MMTTDDDPIVDVIFRVWRGNAYGDDVIALFPTLEHNGSLIVSYEHLGQHGGADYGGCIQRTRPAKPHEYANLKAELESLGYRLRVRSRRVR